MERGQHDINHFYVPFIRLKRKIEKTYLIFFSCHWWFCFSVVYDVEPENISKAIFTAS